MSGPMNVFDIAGRAMSAQLVRMNSSASNLANAGSISGTAEGAYRSIKPVFKTELDRNHRLRVVAPAQELTSMRLQAYTLPGFELSFRALSPGVVRLYQRYTVPKQVRLNAPTLFYLGRRGAARASIRRTGNLKHVRAGRYTSHVTVTLPSSWNGAFRYASCFRASVGSGMGDPDQSCPKLALRF